jgi:sulfur carrier protein ThiS
LRAYNPVNFPGPQPRRTGEVGVPRVKVVILPDGRTVEVEASTAGEILRKLGLSSESYIVIGKDRPLLEDDEVNGEVKVVRVLSGGSQV